MYSLGPLSDFVAGGQVGLISETSPEEWAIPRVRLPSVRARLVRHASVSACRVKQLQSAERRSCNVMAFW